MAQKVDFRNKERKEPTTFITESGLYRHKIVKHEVYGYTNEGNEKHKYTLECNKITSENGKPTLSKEVYTITSTYNADEKQEWVFMNLANALKIDVAFDPSSLVGYSFMADVEMKVGFTDPDKKFANINPYSYRYSKANDELPPVPAIVEEVVADSYAHAEVVEYIDDSELPF